MNDSILWFITYSERGDGQPSGFYCPSCFENKIENKEGFLKDLVSIVSPDSTPKYECDLCGMDYRDCK